MSRRHSLRNLPKIVLIGLALVVGFTATSSVTRATSELTKEFRLPQTEHDRALNAYWTGDFDQSFDIWQKAAKRGDVDSQYYLGHLYIEGRGTLIDLKKAAYWFFQAAEQDHLLSMIEFSLLKEDGVLTPFTDATSEYWQVQLEEMGDGLWDFIFNDDRFSMYTGARLAHRMMLEAAEEGDKKSGGEWAEGSMLSYYAFLTNKNLDEAREFSDEIGSKAAGKRTWSMSSMCFVLDDNDACMSDKEKSAHISKDVFATDLWIAQQGIDVWQKQMGRLYLDRTRSEYDPAQAKYFLQKSAQRGNHDAYFWLGNYYSNHEIDYDAAIQKYDTAIKIASTTLGSTHPKVSLFRNWSNYAYLAAGYIDEAKELALESVSPHLVEEDPATYARDLANLAESTRVQGRHKQALLIIQQADRIWNAHSLSTSDDRYAGIQETYGAILMNHGGERHDELQVIAKRLIELYPKRTVAYGLLADVYAVNGEIQKAEQLYTKRLSLSAINQGQEHPERVNNLRETANFYFYVKNDLDTALSLMEEAKRLNEKYFPPHHESFFPIHYQLANFYVYSDQAEKSQTEADNAIETYLSQVASGQDVYAGGGQGYWNYQSSFETLLNVAWGSWINNTGGGKNNRQEIINKTFRYYQLIKRSASGQSISKLASRFQSADTDIALLIRDIQDLKIEKTALEKKIVAMMGQSTNLDGSDVLSNLQNDHNKYALRLDVVQSMISDGFPKYQDLTRNRPLSIAQIQDSLESGEALIAYLTLSWFGRQDITYVWVFTPEVSEVILIDHSQSLPNKPVIDEVIADSAASEAGLQEGDILISANQHQIYDVIQLSQLISAHADEEIVIEVLRQGVPITVEMTPREMTLEGESRVAIGVRFGMYETLDEAVQVLRDSLVPDGAGEIRPFNVGLALQLYAEFLWSFEKLLEGVSNILLVPDGALSALPFHLLVTEYPEKINVYERVDGSVNGQRGFTIEKESEETDIRKKSLTDPFKDYRNFAWLARKYAITTLPSVTSLRSLREYANISQANQPFVGFGNPLLKGGTQIAGNIEMGRVFPRGAVADVNAIRHLSQLPDTADELMSIAKTLGATNDSVYLGEEATEERVKTIDLSRSKVLAFATHGLVSGDLPGLAEPGLVLTPPNKGTSRDDGILTASEVAQLRLDADWVILSACNTAAGSSNNTDGLSTLSSAFFYAGARALLVSHWPVWSDATTTLVKRIFKERNADSTIGRAEALRRAMLAMIDDTENPRYAHPQFWAPFVVVGEGGN